MTIEELTAQVAELTGQLAQAQDFAEAAHVQLVAAARATRLSAVQSVFA